MNSLASEPKLKVGKELRQKRILSALTEFVTGTLHEGSCRNILRDNGCFDEEIDALIRSAPKTIKPRTKPNFKGEQLPLLSKAKP